MWLCSWRSLTFLIRKEPYLDRSQLKSLNKTCKERILAHSLSQSLTSTNSWLSATYKYLSIKRRPRTRPVSSSLTLCTTAPQAYKTFPKLFRYTRWLSNRLRTRKSAATRFWNWVWFTSLVMAMLSILIMTWHNNTTRKLWRRTRVFKYLSTWWVSIVNGRGSM